MYKLPDTGTAFDFVEVIWFGREGILSTKEIYQGKRDCFHSSEDEQASLSSSLAVYLQFTFL